MREFLAARILGGDMYTEGEEYTPEQLDGIRILDDRFQLFFIRISTSNKRLLVMWGNSGLQFGHSSKDNSGSSE